MEHDFKVVTHSLPSTDEFINIYPLGDVHIGSSEFNMDKFEDWIRRVRADDNGYVVIIGDLMDIATRSSKTNLWEEEMTPLQQKQYLTEMLYPIRHKILGVVPGNHERRMMYDAGVNPLYDVCCKLNIEHLYRENACFIKLGVGSSKKNPDRQVQYGLALVHGATQNRHDNFCNSIDGVDVIFSGHDHKARHVPRGKIRFNLNVGTVQFVPYQEVVVLPFQETGGYSLRGEYLPTCVSGTQVIRLYSGARRVDYEYSQT